MQVAIVSDIHDHIPELERILSRVEAADLLLCCGDLCSPFMVGELANGFSGPVHVVFGNNDGDAFRITRAAAERDDFHLQGEMAELELDDERGTRVALHHFPEVGRRLAASGAYDLVCFGHSHEWEVLEVGGCVAVNPGEVMGRFGAPTCALYDTGRGELEKIEA